MPPADDRAPDTDLQELLHAVVEALERLALERTELTGLLTSIIENQHSMAALLAELAPSVSALEAQDGHAPAPSPEGDEALRREARQARRRTAQLRTEARELVARAEELRKAAPAVIRDAD